MCNTNTQIELVAEAINSGKQVYVCDLQPGNGSRYLMVFSSLEDAGPAANMIGGFEDRHVLSLPYFKTSFPVNLPGYFTSDYVASKWTYGNEVDGEVIANFLNRLSELLNLGA